VTYQILAAGFGGQGVMSLGMILTYAGMLERRKVSWMPSYGPEMRGGTANCSVMISDRPIGSPIVTEPNILIVMNKPSLARFEPAVVSGGLIMVNSSLIDTDVERDDVEVLKITANDLAEELGNAKVANVVMLGALIEAKSPVSFDSVVRSLKEVFKGGKEKLIDLNVKALEKGRSAASERG